MYYVTIYFKHTGFWVLKHDLVQQITFDLPCPKEMSVSGDVLLAPDDLKSYQDSTAHKKELQQHFF